MKTQIETQLKTFSVTKVFITTVSIVTASSLAFTGLFLFFPPLETEQITVLGNAQRQTLQETKNVKVATISYMNSEYPADFNERITELQNIIIDTLNSGMAPIDLIFDPEWTLNMSTSSSDPAIVTISQVGDEYFVNSTGGSYSNAVAEHVNWLKSTMGEFDTNYFANVHERIELSGHPDVVGQTGLIINHEGKIVDIKRKNNFHPLPEPIEEWRNTLVGSTINSFTLENHDQKEFTVLPFICGDVSEYFRDWYTAQLHANNAQPADIVIHAEAQGDANYLELFEAIQSSTFNPDNFWVWEYIDSTFIQHYQQQEGLIKSTNSFYFVTDKYGFGTTNNLGLEIKSYPPGPTPFADWKYIQNDDYLIIDAEIKGDVTCSSSEESCIEDNSTCTSINSNFFCAEDCFCQKKKVKPTPSQAIPRP
ncbi:MAG: hypothetical protein ABIB97_00560 [Patescibacteria group bacterium]